ncbi:MAG: hypothetical protein WB626_09580 [Bacteroidota bacterium]
MKSRIIVAVLALMLVGTSCEIVDPFLIALNLPLTVCDTISAGSTWSEDDTYDIREEIRNISASYVEDVRATRVNDISVFMPNPPAAGTASGTVDVALDNQALQRLLTFSNVPFSLLAGDGISLRDEITGGGSVTIDFNNAVVASLLAALQDSTGLPSISTVRIQTAGSTSVAVPQGTRICAKISYQADVQIGGD